MERQMRNTLICVTACVLGAIGSGTAPGLALAAPSPSLSSGHATGLVVEAGWRRYYERHSYVPVTPPVVDETASGDVTVLPPMVYRPSSCGEFYYWNGQACVDARFIDPDLRPRG
jgi:hypothetical protein